HPNDLQGNLRLGESAFALKDYKAAAKAYKASLAMKETKIFTPKVLEISAKAANAMLADNNTKEANSLIDNLIKRVPGHPLPQYLRALGAYLERDYQKAKDHLLNVLKVLPNHAPSLFLLGAVNYGGEHLEMAEMYLSKFVATAPSHVSGRKLLGATRMKLEQPADAVEALMPAMEENSQDVQLLLLMGAASVSSGEHKKGIEFLKKAVKKSPGDIAIRNELALAYLKSNQIGKAIVELEALTGLKPATEPNTMKSGYRTNSLLILAYLKDGKSDKALSVATKLVADNGNNPHAYTLLGQVKLVTGTLRQGQEYFKTALVKRPGYLPATMLLAKTLEMHKQYQQAKDLYLVSYNDNPKHIGLLLSLAKVSEKLRDIEASLDWLEKARAADEKAIKPKLILARYFMQRDMMWKAREFVAEADEVAPGNIEVLKMQGILKLRENSPSAAIKIFKNTVQKYPKRAEPHY
ncbi:MAG: tetratricopeptide repeat protein, partial [Gammaproteobacteria bacterium]|nr:tetratricopeptide repeat protein [Gammaproteobacteria bacterium]